MNKKIPKAYLYTNLFSTLFYVILLGVVLSHIIGKHKHLVGFYCSLQAPVEKVHWQSILPDGFVVIVQLLLVFLGFYALYFKNCSHKVLKIVFMLLFNLTFINAISLPFYFFFYHSTITAFDFIFECLFAIQITYYLSKYLLYFPFLLPFLLAIMSCILLIIWQKKEGIFSFKNVLLYYFYLLLGTFLWVLIAYLKIFYGHAILKIIYSII